MIADCGRRLGGNERRMQPRGSAISTRRGATIVLGVLFVGATCVVMAFVVNICRLHFTRSQLQAAADAGAMAATAKLRAQNSELETYSYGDSLPSIDRARSAAIRVVSANSAAHRKRDTQQPLIVEENFENLDTGDIVFGRVDSLGQSFQPTLHSPNATKVQVGFRAMGQNGRLGILFGGLLGTSDTDMICSAKAMTRVPTLLPFVVYEPQWDSMQSGQGRDDFAVDGDTLMTGSDGNLEVTVFPNDWDGLDMPPGNFGWVDLSTTTGTDTLCRIVDEGPSQSDLDSIGGAIDSGEVLSGTTEFRSSAEVAFVGGEYNGKIYGGILGHPRYIALYNSATGAGTNATFTVSKFVMVRVVYANLTSSPKSIVVQPVNKREALERVWLVQ